MALQVNCSMCNGHFEADALAIRRGLMVCPFCMTVNRITAVGAEKYEAEIRERPLPPEIQRRDLPSGGLELRVKVNDYFINLPVSPQRFLKNLKWAPYIGIGLFVAWFVFIAVVSGSGDDSSSFLLSCFAIFFPCIAVLLAIMGLAIFKPEALKYQPTVKVADGVVYPAANVDSPEIAVGDIRQIYTAVTKVTNEKLYTYCHVYALMQNDKRLPLIGQIPTAEIALMVEELLEVSLNLFDLPVYGDVAIADKAPPPPPVAPKRQESLICMSCAAQLAETAEATRQGYIVCAYCNSLTLLYMPGTSKLILGLPDIRSGSLPYKVVKEDGRIQIRATQEKFDRPLLSLSPQKITIHSVIDGDVNLPVDMIENVFVKEERGKPGERPSNTGQVVANMLTEYVESMAYSDEMDGEELALRLTGFIRYHVVAKANTGDEIVLLPYLKNARDAFTFANFFADYLKHVGGRGR